MLIEIPGIDLTESYVGAKQFFPELIGGWEIESVEIGRAVDFSIHIGHQIVQVELFKINDRYLINCVFLSTAQNRKVILMSAAYSTFP